MPISFKIYAYINEKLKIEITDGTNHISEYGNILNKAINKKTTKEEILEKLSKLGNTPFYLTQCEIKKEDVFIPMSEINNIKRALIEKLILKKTSSSNKINFTYEKKIINQNIVKTSYLIRNENQLIHYLNKGRIYTENYNLYMKYKNNNVYYKLPRIMNNYPDYQNENLLVSDLGSVYKYANKNNVIADYPLNIANSETINFLHSLGVKISTISPEVTDFTLEKYSYPTEKIVYGKPDLMILKAFNENGDYLKNKQGKKFKIIYGPYTTILHSQNINLENHVGRHILLNETF